MAKKLTRIELLQENEGQEGESQEFWYLVLVDFPVHVDSCSKGFSYCALRKKLQKLYFFLGMAACHWGSDL